MAYYQQLQPGLSQVGNLPLPLDDQTMQAMGYAPMAPPVAPVDPGSALGPNAVAGGHGAPLPLQTVDADQHVDTLGQQQIPASAIASGPTPDEHRQIADAAKAQNLAAAGGIPNLFASDPSAQPATARGLTDEDRAELNRQAHAKEILPTTGGKAERQVERQEDDLSRLYARADAEAARGAAQPRGLGVAGETRKFTEQAPMDPALAASIKQHQGELDQAQSNALEDQALHEGDRLEQEQELNRQRMEAAQAQIQQRQAIDQRIRKLEAQSDAAQAEIANRTPKGLSDYWRDQGAAVQIGSAIAAVIGGWFQGRNGGQGPNSGIEQINKNIDRWMNDQQQQYENAKSDAQLKNNAYRDAIAVYGSPEVAQAQLQLQAYTARDAMIKNTAQQIGTQDALNNAQILLQQGQLEREKAMAASRGAIQVEQTLKMQGGGAGGGGVIAALERRAKIKDLANRVTGNTIPEREQALKEEEAGNKSRASLQASQDVVDAADRVKQLTKDMASREPGEAAGKAKIAYLDLKAQMLKQYGWSGRQMAVIDQAIADPTSFVRNPGAAAQLDEIARIARAKAVRAAAGHAAGVEPEPEFGESME